MATPPLLVLGNVNLELILGTLDKWPDFESETIMSTSNLRAGGAAGNAALALSGLSVEHRLIAAIGNDGLGNWLKNEFQPSTTTWSVVPAATAVSVSVLHDDGRVFLTSEGHLAAATVDTMLDAIPPATAKSSFALVTGTNLMPNITAGMSQLLTMLSTMGWTTVLDHGRPTEGWNEDTISVYRAWVRASDMVIIYEDDLCAIMHEDDVEDAQKALVRTLAEHQVLIVLRGLSRVDAFYQGKMVSAEGDEIDAKDTVGFGDIFNAGFLNSYMAGEGLQASLEAGLTVAALAVTTSPRLYGVFVD